MEPTGASNQPGRRKLSGIHAPDFDSQVISAGGEDHVSGMKCDRANSVQMARVNGHGQDTVTVARILLTF